MVNHSIKNRGDRLMSNQLQMVRSILSTTAARWLSMTETMPVELLARILATGEWAAHDLMHTVQAERAMMQSFILGSGTWRPFFLDHDVSK
jgi:hypothetical protein